MRTKFICGNWKMNGTPEETRKLVAQLSARWKEEYSSVEVAICPPFPSIALAAEHLFSAPIQLGAQNVHWEMKGAFTGEVSAPMLVELGCSYVIVGHSERRTLFYETDEIIAKKVAAVIRSSMRPILCIGESGSEREASQTEEVLSRQLKESLAGIEAQQMENVVLSYEPVWAIGTGKTATPDLAENAHKFIRSKIEELFGGAIAERIIIQYGGSMKPDNALALLSEPNIDGGLIGGAALDAEAFMSIVASAAEASSS